MEFAFMQDTPVVAAGVTRVQSPMVVAGWTLLPDDGKVRSVDIEVNGRLEAQASVRVRRPDVAKVYPDRRGAAYSGFAAELMLDDCVGETATVQVVVRGQHDEFRQGAFEVLVDGLAGETVRRPRCFSLPSILACPVCGSDDLIVGARRVCCGDCQSKHWVRRGTPVFAPDGCPADARLLESCFTHPYSDVSMEIIRSCTDGLVLDFGSGNPAPDKHYPHVVFHEAVQYAQSDVVCLTSRLPYRDGAFDAIVSQAVFEHVPRPWETAAELHRVLKPGGRIHIDTAFMQPFHGDPCHYFNMTLSGLRVIFQQFEERQAGVKPYQSATQSLRMQLNSLGEHVTSERWREFIRGFLAELDSESLNDSLDESGHEALAAGVFFDGVKAA